MTTGVELMNSLTSPRVQGEANAEARLGDAQVWMTIAEELYMRNAKAPEDFSEVRRGSRTLTR